MDARRTCRWRLLPAAALLALAAAPGCRQEAAKAPPTGPPEVLVSRPTDAEITDFEDFTGRLDAVRSVEVRARVTGYLEALHFQDGKEVKEGDLLFEIDPRPYQAEVERTEAALAQAQAKERRMATEYNRARALYGRGLMTQEEVDLASADLADAKGAVGVARAARDLARLNLGFTKVTAPISGRISRRMVDPGNMVQADVTALTTIVALEPLYVYFEIDERTLLRLRKLIPEGKVKTREQGPVSFFVALADEEEFRRKGMIDFSDNRVDPNTGTLQVRGLIENPSLRSSLAANTSARELSPGMFVRVRLPIGAPYHALTVPEQALGTDQGRKFVYVVDAEDKVVYRPVQVGPLNNGRRVVLDPGLKATDRVVVSGLQRIRPGDKVIPRLVQAVADLDDPDESGALAGEPGPGKPPTAGG